MKRKIKPVALALLFLFVAIQFYQPARNSNKEQDETMDIAQSNNIPADVKRILHISCYDCHSSNTNYVWYNYIQPARMIVESHIKRARKDLNFSEWGTYSNRKKERLLTSIKKQIETKEMPLPSYTLMHENARLNEVRAKILIDWIQSQE
ncbi:heme-binding domain-containing protein [Niabella sp. CJ426]|uniref:heme-binding domain-containing protein n=1 Tax=Niabella sp. CJ426 TaxID=3393740 RepID=UPI003D0380E0